MGTTLTVYDLILTYSEQVSWPIYSIEQIGQLAYVLRNYGEISVAEMLLNWKTIMDKRIEEEFNVADA